MDRMGPITEHIDDSPGIHQRGGVMLRLAILAGVLGGLAGMFGIALRLGSGTLVALVALATLALFAARLAAVCGVSQAARLFERFNQLGEQAEAALQQHTDVAPIGPPDTRQDWQSQTIAPQPFTGLMDRLRAAVSNSGKPNASVLSGAQWLSVFAVACAFGIPLALRLYRLADLQAEVYGDINIVFEYMQAIRSGSLPFRFVLSSGPLYHYLIAPLIGLTGLSYTGIKLASVVCSVAILVFIYLIGRAVRGRIFGLLAVFVAGVSSWLLAFSRLGNSQIIVPLVAVASLYFLVRYQFQPNRINTVLCAGIAALGFYGYPQSFVIAPAMFLTFALMQYASERRFRWRDLALFVGVTGLVAAPFIVVLANAPTNFADGYIGDKFFGAAEPLRRVINNSASAMAAFHVRGDLVFRSNPSGVPHLDIVSGILMLLGVAYWLLPGNRRWTIAWVLPFLLLQIPSILVLNFNREVPSASRTLGIAPVTYLLVASGLWFVLVILRKRIASRAAAPMVGLAALALILGLNAQRYFGDYIAGLPYNNTPVARIATDFVNTLPEGTNVYLYGCCWTAGMPEPKSIQYEMRQPRTLVELPPGSLTCATLQQIMQPPAVLFWSPQNPVPDAQVAQCMDALPGQLYVSPEGRPVYYAASVRPVHAMSPLDSPLATPEPAADLPVMARPEDAGAGVLVMDDALSSVEVAISGRAAALSHSELDTGEITNMIDGSPNTLVRGAKANPFVIDIAFLEPQALMTVKLKTQTLAQTKIIVTVIAPDGQTTTTSHLFRETEPDPLLTLPLGMAPGPVSDLRIEIIDQRQLPTEGYHMHVYELTLE